MTPNKLEDSLDIPKWLLQGTSQVYPQLEKLDMVYGQFPESSYPAYLHTSVLLWLLDSLCFLNTFMMFFFYCFLPCIPKKNLQCSS